MPPWNVRFCSAVRRTALDWLWPGYLPRGKLVVLDGDPEMGKSLITLDLIARLGRGRPLPDGAPAGRPVTSVLLSAEDDAADTICPRAEAAGADLDRLVLPDWGDRPPRFPEHVPALEELIRACDAALVVIDPLMAFLPPGVAANLDQCVRQALTPLARLTARTRCTVLFVRHLTKHGPDRAVCRGQGSMGIVAAVRSALFAAPHPLEPGVRVLSVAKGNLADRPPTLGYRVVGSASGQPVVEWTGRAEVTADEACRGEPEPVGVRPRDRAIDWLRRELAGGPRKAAELYAAAAEAGIPERTLDRAKAALRAASHREYDTKAGSGEWYWYDRDAAWPEDAPFKKPYELPPLGPLEL